ncbi:MAG TPA: DUF1697 domain-containing protein [Candidatus Limnocylindrales bacterium]|nr:DUF1697 domain-containing protein [Candidatus Limnocylindrales bacterium]
MTSYVVLLRGINVGGKNKVPMARLRQLLEDLGYECVRTYIASGNVILRSERAPADIRARIEAALPGTFQLQRELVAVLVLSHDRLRAIIDRKPAGFGEDPERYHSDVIFLMGIDPSQAMGAFDPRPGVDTVWAGDGVIYSQRLSAERTRSRLSKVMSSPLYQSMTIRNWATTVALLRLLDEMAAARDDASGRG